VWIDIGIMVVQVLILVACVIVEGRVRRVERRIRRLEDEEATRWWRQLEINNSVIKALRGPDR
jgi:hypothetical protein